MIIDKNNRFKLFPLLIVTCLFIISSYLIDPPQNMNCVIIYELHSILNYAYSCYLLGLTFVFSCLAGNAGIWFYIKLISFLIENIFSDLKSNIANFGANLVKIKFSTYYLNELIAWNAV